MPIRFYVPLPGPFVWTPRRRRRRPDRPLRGAFMLVATGVAMLGLGLYFALHGAPMMLGACVAVWLWQVAKDHPPKDPPTA